MSRTALLVLVVAFAAAVVTVVTGRHLNGLNAERDAASAAADSVTVVAGALRTKMAGIAVAGSPGDHGQTYAVAASRGVSLAALTVARDSGAPVLDDAAEGVAVVARYDTSTAPLTVQDRRNHVTGYDVVALDLAGTLKSVIPAQGGISVSGPDRRMVSIPSSGPGSAASFTTSLGPDLPSGWSITVWTTPTTTPMAAWLLSLVLLAAGVTAAGWIALRQTDSRRRRDELRGLQQTGATVAALAILAQHSMDLGEVLPAVTTELSSALGLRGLSLAVQTPLGERPIFVLGVPPDPVEPVQVGGRLEAGQTLAVVLSRGGRFVATLRVTAGRDLDRDEVRTLIASGDVLTSALANAELFAQQAELIARMRTVDDLKTMFLGTASHELRTPVTALAGYANLLHSDWDNLAPDEARTYAERVDSIAQRLSRLVEDILDFSRLQSGHGPGDTSVLDLAETVGQVLDEQPDLAPDHLLTYEAGSALPVVGSRQAVERVVTNLVGNAAKYSDAGCTISVLTRQEGELAEIVVADQGPGIPADQREYVFSPFYRGSGDEVVRTRGAGLGLAIVAEFAASMGGQVRVDEAEGGGASFVVSYPIVVPAPVLDPGASDVQT